MPNHTLKSPYKNREVKPDSGDLAVGILPETAAAARVPRDLVGILPETAAAARVPRDLRSKPPKVAPQPARVRGTCSSIVLRT